MGAALDGPRGRDRKRLPDFTLEASFTSGSGPLGILGPSGAGKTMLLRCIAGLERPDRGRIVLKGRTLFDSERNVQVPARARRIGMLFQNYTLFPHRTVEENVAFGIHGLPRDERSERVNIWLQRTHARVCVAVIHASFPEGSSSAPHWRGPFQSIRTHCCWMNLSRPSIPTCEAKWKHSFRKHLQRTSARHCW